MVYRARREDEERGALAIPGRTHTSPGLFLSRCCLEKRNLSVRVSIALAREWFFFPLSLSVCLSVCLRLSSSFSDQLLTVKLSNAFISLFL